MCRFGVVVDIITSKKFSNTKKDTVCVYLRSTLRCKLLFPAYYAKKGWLFFSIGFILFYRVLPWGNGPDIVRFFLKKKVKEKEKGKEKKRVFFPNLNKF